jgi:hypothetical protein
VTLRAILTLVVLPALCPDLAYGSLDGVQDGQAAQGAFLEAASPRDHLRAQDRDRATTPRLLRTRHLAMVRLWEFFRGKAV